MKEKGGCAVGKKTEKGGCKVGKKKVKAKPKVAAAIRKNKIEKAKGGCAVGKKTGKGGCKIGNKTTKTAAPAAKKKKMKFKVIASLKPKKVKSTAPDNMLKPRPKPKKAPAPPKRKINFNKNPIELPELKAITGLTKKQANAMSPLELFGMLPKELATNIVLNPKATGVKVGSKKPALIKGRDATKILSSPNGKYFEDELKKLPTGEGFSGGKKYFVDEIRKWEKKTEIKYGLNYRYKVPRGASIIGPRRKLARYNALEESGYLKFESEIRKLNKKDDETKFGGSAKLTSKDVVDAINKIIRIGTPRAKLGSKNMIKMGNEFGKALLLKSRWTLADYDKVEWANLDQIKLKKRLDLLEKTMKDAGSKSPAGTYGGSGRRLPEILQTVGLRK